MDEMIHSPTKHKTMETMILGKYQIVSITVREINLGFLFKLLNHEYTNIILDYTRST